ncbi:MAG: helix-turn-helix domain-containing protein [Pseudomonadota bacterium]
MPYKGYGQYCPLALAAEILCERWTLLVISRVVDGCTRFNEIHRGVPKISATLLSNRLARLEDAGLITSRPQESGHGREYQLTDAGRDLDPIIMSLAGWGQKWARDMEGEDLDPAFLAWSMHTRLNVEAMPAGKTVLAFEFSGTHKGFSRFWLVAEDGQVDMCLKYPGTEPAVTLKSDIRRFVEAWRGFRDLKSEISSGHVRIEGEPSACRALPDWLMLSALAPVPRITGNEAKVAAKHQTHSERRAEPA